LFILAADSVTHITHVHIPKVLQLSHFYAVTYAVTLGCQCSTLWDFFWHYLYWADTFSVALPLLSKC